MKYFIIAGERSGDLHGSNLIKGILKHDPQAEICAWGGKLMEDAGAKILKNYEDLAFMGFVEVLKNVFKIIGFLSECKKQILDFQPDSVILIDYAGFNMRIAKFAKQNNFKVFYYISPKVWAWNQKRALKLKANVDKLFCIFPFEVDFFKKYDFDVEYVGNPLLDAIDNYQAKGGEQKIHQTSYNQTSYIRHQKIALLPGSRKQEVEKMLPVMVSVAKFFPDYVFEIARVDNLSEELYKPFLNEQIRLSTSSTYNLLCSSVAALVTSGTATLETALLNTSQVVCYQANWISYQIGKRVIRVPFISLVNLIAQKEVVKELIQGDFNTKNLVEELTKLLPPNSFREQQLADYQALKTLIGEIGASERTGKRIVELMSQ